MTKSSLTFVSIHTHRVVRSIILMDHPVANTR